MTESPTEPMNASARDFRDEDWYGEPLGAARFRGCTFTGVDFSEASTAGAVFEECTFHNCRFNSSTHTATAFVACDVRRTSFFDATLDGCKLSGTVFTECVLRPMRILGGQWQGVTVRGTNLARLDLSGLDLREADLSGSDLTAAVLAGARLDRASLRQSTLDLADLRGAVLDGADLTAARLRRTRVDLAGAVLLAELQGAEVDTSV